MPSFLDNLIGTVNTPSNAFNYGAGAANALYPAAQGYGPGDAGTISAVIAAQQAEADRQYNLSKQQLDQNYKIALMNARTQQDVQRANAEYQAGQLKLAQDRLQFDRETQAQEFGLKQANLGYNLVGQLAQLHGPENYFTAANYSRGVAAQPGTSVFLNALSQNARLPGFGAQAGAPAAETGNTLLAKLSGQPVGAGTTFGAANAAGLPASLTAAGGGAGSGSADDAYVNQIHAIAARGAQGLGAGMLEQLSPDELALFKAGLEAPDSQGNAYSAASFLDQYNKSRIAQTIGGGGYRAA